MSKLWVLPIFLFSFVLHAQTSEDLDLIQVDATKKAGAFDLGASAKIPEEDLENRPTPQLSSLIDAVPGVISNQNGGPGGRVSFFVRGTESRHLSFTLDGLKLNDVSNVDRQFDAAFLTSPILQEMTVFKGPQAVLFGSDSFGGLVEMKTRKGEKAPETRFNFSGGSFGTVAGSLSSDWKTKNNQGTLTYSQNHSDGISRLNKKRFNASEKDSSDITQATSSSSHKWGMNKTDLLFSFIDGKNELDGATTDNSHDHSTNHQYLVQQKTSHYLDKSTAISLRNGLNRHQRFINTLALGQQNFAGNSIQNEVLFEKKLLNTELLGGVATEHESAEMTGIDRSFDLHSGFLQSVFKRDGFSAQAGGRFDRHSRYGNFQTGSAGASYVFQNQKFYMQYSQGYKAPSVYQLYYPQYGNQNLVPERNHSWEGGWKFSSDLLGLDVAFFQNRLSNLITFTNSGFLNQGNFIAEGVELTGRISAEKFVVRPSFVHQNFRHEETTVLRRPKNMASIQTSWFVRPEIELFAKARWYSARKDFDPNQNTIKLNSFENLDLGAHYVQGLNDWSLQLVNILNRDYEELYGYSVMPFSVFAGYGRKINF